MWMGGAASSSDATEFSVFAEGMTVFEGASFSTEGVVTGQSDGQWFETWSAAADLSFIGAGSWAEGVFALSGKKGSLFAEFAGNAAFGGEGEGGFSIAAIPFTITGGTGRYDGATGSGIWSLLVEPGGMTHSSFFGTYVPAPGALAALAATIALLPRRRRTV
jgi:hypothetical protein